MEDKDIQRSFWHANQWFDTSFVHNKNCAQLKIYENNSVTVFVFSIYNSVAAVGYCYLHQFLKLISWTDDEFLVYSGECINGK